MQQSSAQGIASLYRGNPQPLQQAIQKEQQAKPGLPPDLQKMLALQIVTNEKDGFAAQKAMEQLRQMGGQQGGKPPTVMASLEQQAKQKLEAQAQQARQQAEMRGLPAGLMGVQGEPPQPEAQPEAQGIDQSDRVAFAGAEGGIVAFDRGGEVDTAKDDAKAAIAQLQAYGLAQRKDDPEGYEAAQAQAAAAKERLLAIQAAYAQEMSAAGMDRPAQVTGMPKARPQQTAPQVEDNQSAAETARLQRQKSLPQAPAPAPVRDLKALAALRTPAPAPAPAPVAAQPPAAVADSAALKMVKDRMSESPETREAREIAKYKTAIGAPDTTQHDRLIAELEKRKESLAPKQGFEGLMEYLGEISRADSRGRGSFAAGAAGAARLNDLNKDRALQQFELSKQAIDVSQKKLDTVRSYAKDVYGVGKTAFDQVYKDQYDAAKELVKDENEARKLAQENTLKRLQMQNNLDVQREQNRGSLATANARGAGGMGAESKEIAAAEAAFARDPEAKALAKTLETYAMSPTNPNAVKAATRLREIQAAKYKQFGLTLEGAPGAKSPSGTNQQGWSIKPLQ